MVIKMGSRLRDTDFFLPLAAVESSRDLGPRFFRQAHHNQIHEQPIQCQVDLFTVSL